MQTSDKKTGQETESPRTKGGGDGSAKAATGDNAPAKTNEEASSAGSETQGGLRSRKITTKQG